MLKDGCLEIDFQSIAIYDKLKALGEEYVPFPGALNTEGVPDCTGLTPAGIKCELLTNFRIRMTLPSDTLSVDGKIGGMVNQFSANVDLKINIITYRSPAGLGCLKETADLSTQTTQGLSDGISMVATRGEIPLTNIKVETTAAYAIVGGAPLENVLKIELTPLTGFSVYGG